MKKVKSYIQEMKKNFIIIEFISVILLISIISLMFKFIIYSTKTENTVLVEYSKINITNISNENNIGNAKIEILDDNQLSYYIKVNLKKQIVVVYTSNQNGEYNIPIKVMLCSTGIATPKEGVFTISDKYEWRYLVGDVYGQYATRITGQILFHSVPYTNQEQSSLEYWEYDKLGQPVSKGCVRLTVEDAKWIYDYCSKDTKVEFCENDSNEENFEQPVKMKISEYSNELKCWDPTDPDENNPWIKYNKQNKGEN